MRFALFFPLLALLAVAPSMAAERAVRKPLYFQANRNNVQVLAQRFEYDLMDANRLRMGDILIDSTKLHFQVSRAGTGDGYVLRFQWPAGLFKDGSILLLNNNGKALWTGEFTPDTIQITADKSVTDEDIRSEIGQFTSETVPRDLIEDMKFLPFMKFCLNKSADTSKTYLCSRDLYLAVTSSGIEIKERSTSKKEAFVEMNGKQVTPQGLVYLNDANEDLYMLAQTESGASLEIITRKLEVDFKDAILSADGTKIVITASGAEPARSKGVKKVGDGVYEVELPRVRPYYFLLGEGGIPMRQEFFIKGELPTEAIRPSLSPSAPDKTFSSSVDVEGANPDKTQVRAEGKGSRLRSSSGRRFVWELGELQAGPNRRYLAVQDGAKTFVVGYDVERGFANVLEVSGRFDAPSGAAHAGFAYRRWMESFLGSEFHWGAALEYDKALTKSDNYADIDFMTLALHYQTTESFPFQASNWRLGLLASSLKIAGENGVAPGIEILREGPLGVSPKSWLKDRLHWGDMKLRFWSGTSGSKLVKLSPSWLIDGGVYRRFGRSAYLRVSAGVSQFKTDLDLKGDKIQVGAGAALQYNF